SKNASCKGSQAGEICFHKGVEQACKAWCDGEEDREEAHRQACEKTCGKAFQEGNNKACREKAIQTCEKEAIINPVDLCVAAAEVNGSGCSLLSCRSCRRCCLLPDLGFGD